MAITRTRPREAAEVGVRTFLRHPRPDDERDFVALMRASRRLHRPWMTSTGEHSFERYVLRSDRPDIESFLVCKRADGEMAGFINLSQITYGGLCTATCGYAAFAASAGQGYLTEGVGLALRYAFTTLNLHRIEANIQPGNQRSRALAERCGFRLEGFSPSFLKIGGRWRDHERWAITAEQWKDARRRRPAP